MGRRLALGEAPKRRRVQLAKSEVWMFLATTAQRWADDVADRGGGRPFAGWEKEGEVDPFHELGRIYGLDQTDLAKLIEDQAAQLEYRAIRAGFEETWRP